MESKYFNEVAKLWFSPKRTFDDGGTSPDHFYVEFKPIEFKNGDKNYKGIEAMIKELQSLLENPEKKVVRLKMRTPKEELDSLKNNNVITEDAYNNRLGRIPENLKGAFTLKVD